MERMAEVVHESILFVVSGPSGSGKETIISRLLSEVEGLSRISTYSTRSMRPGETQGTPYHFISDHEFDRLVASGEIFEYETVYGSYRYGSPKSALTAAGDRDFLMELDPNGFRRMKKSRCSPTVGIFLLVPDLATLNRRIMQRHAESDVEARIAAARQQIRESSDYDYLLMNDDLETCCRNAVRICRVERLRRDGKVQQQRLAAD
jgi:guanylate kinase